MTADAIDVVLDVGLMIELDIVWNIKDTNPRHRRLRVIVPPLLHNLWMLGDDVLVAEQTLPHRGNACVL